MYSVAEFMTRELVTVREEDDLAHAEAELRRAGIRHLPVVTAGRLTGVITHRDLLRSGHFGRDTARGVPVRAHMTPEPLTASPGASLAEAARTMLARKIGCLPVCDEAGTLVGIITESDFVRFAADMVSDLDRVAEAVAARGDRP